MTIKRGIENKKTLVLVRKVPGLEKIYLKKIDEVYSSSSLDAVAGSTGAAGSTGSAGAESSPVN